MKLPALIGVESAELLDLGTLVEEIAAERARTLPPAVQLVVDVASNLARVHGVRSELEHLVASLLELWLSAVPEAGSIGLVVDQADDGDGIRLEVLNVTGNPQLPAPPPRLDRGDTLAVVLAVVGRHHATLRVSSFAAGATRLEIVFPLGRTRDRTERCRRPTFPPRLQPSRSIH